MNKHEEFLKAIEDNFKLGVSIFLKYPIDKDKPELGFKESEFVVDKITDEKGKIQYCLREVTGLYNVRYSLEELFGSIKDYLDPSQYGLLF